ncbi:MAG: LamG-like jellyroll fold domain-containing protein, partial [Dolichospermum sp.]
MAVNTRNSIVTNGLVLALDAGNTKSYTSGSTNWRDLSGNNYSGSLINGPTFDNNNGGSIVFDGTNDYIDNIGATSTFSFIQNIGIFTINAWVKLNDLSVARYFIGNNDGTTGAKGFYLGYNGTLGRLWLSMTSGVSGQPILNYISSNNFFTNNDWIHVVCVGNGTNSQFYKNGVIFGSSSTNFGTLSTGNSTQNLSIGRINNFN